MVGSIQFTCTVYTAGYGRVYTCPVYTVGYGRVYTCTVYTAGYGRVYTSIHVQCTVYTEYNILFYLYITFD